MTASAYGSSVIRTAFDTQFQSIFHCSEKTSTDFVIIPDICACKVLKYHLGTITYISLHGHRNRIKTLHELRIAIPVPSQFPGLFQKILKTIFSRKKRIKRLMRTAVSVPQIQLMRIINTLPVNPSCIGFLVRIKIRLRFFQKLCISGLFIKPASVKIIHDFTQTHTIIPLRFIQMFRISSGRPSDRHHYAL